jgi:hypothetical protein
MIDKPKAFWSGKPSKPKAYADDIPVWCSHDEIGLLEKAVPNPCNPNSHPDIQIKLLANILKVQGWRNPITISNQSGFITKGAGRKMAAELNGWSKAPLDYQDYDNEAAEYADLIADNRIAELAEPDLDLVKEILESIEGLDADLTGYDANILLGDAVDDPMAEWEGMPELENTPKAFKTIHIHFEAQKDIDEFALLIGQKITEDTRYLWYPEHEKRDMTAIRFEQEEDES